MIHRDNCTIPTNLYSPSISIVIPDTTAAGSNNNNDHNNHNSNNHKSNKHNTIIINDHV